MTGPTKFCVGTNTPDSPPGYLSDTVEYPGDPDKARIEAARVLLDAYSNNASYGPDVFHALIAWLRTDSTTFQWERGGFVYYIEPSQAPK